MRDNIDPRTFVAFELSRRCRYWHWPSVLAFIKRRNLQRYNFDGCMFGVRDSNGELMRKSWHIATNLHELACLEQYMCTHEHKHGQSRGKCGKSLKSVTLLSTLTLFTAALSIATQASKLPSRSALPAIMAASHMSADLEQRKETLEVFEDHFRQILASGYYLEDGYSEIVDTVINGVLSQHTAHSCLPGLVEKNPWLAPELDPLMRTQKEILATFTGVPASQDYKTIQILIADSALNLVSGSKKKPKRSASIWQIISRHTSRRIASATTMSAFCILWRRIPVSFEASSDFDPRSQGTLPWHYDFGGSRVVGKGTGRKERDRGDAIVAIRCT